MKCKDWKQNFKKRNMENYTFITRNDTIPRNPEPLFVDPYGYTDSIPPNETNDYYKPFPVHLRNPSSCNKCRFVGQHRKFPSPKKRNEKHCISFENDNYDEDYAKEAWNNQYKQELHQYRPFNGRQTDAATYPSIGQSQINPKRYEIVIDLNPPPHLMAISTTYLPMNFMKQLKNGVREFSIRPGRIKSKFEPEPQINTYLSLASKEHSWQAQLVSTQTLKCTKTN